MDSRKIRYFIAGGWNTLFGYFVSVLLYYLLHKHFHLVAIAVLGNVIAITMAFMTYKVFVFQTKGSWLPEYLRAYVVYGGTAILGIGLLWVLVDNLTIPFWIAQGLVMAVTVVISYISHSRFTFRQHKT